MERGAMEEMGKRLIDRARLACSFGVYCGIMMGGAIAGLGTIVVVIVGCLSYLLEWGLFGPAQWFFAISCVVIGMFSLVMYRRMVRRGDMEGDFPEMREYEIFIFSVLLCFMLIVWLAGVWWLYDLGLEMVMAGADVIEMSILLVLVLAILGIIVEKICSFE